MQLTHSTHTRNQFNPWTSPDITSSLTQPGHTCSYVMGPFATNPYLQYKYKCFTVKAQLKDKCSLLKRCFLKSKVKSTEFLPTSDLQSHEMH